MKKIILISLLTLFVVNLKAQLVVTGLTENPVIRECYEKKKQSNKTSRSHEIREWIPITLPFFDDFSTETGYPDTARWMDDEAYINHDFPKLPANLGAATLDAINAKGYIYSNASHFPFIADHLTSRPIRLDSVFSPVPEAISVSDSVYFSFYYQPQGRSADPPEESDSLILEFGHYGDDSVFSYVDSITVSLSGYISPNDTIFPGDTLYSPCDTAWGMAIFDTLYYTDSVTVPCDSIYFPNIQWTRVWSTLGMPLDTFYSRYNVYAKQVIIPILDSAEFYRKDFFFRFYNYASLANIPAWRSNGDQWNIDYVYLNIGRSAADTFYRDIGFVERSPSMLGEFEMMPYDQYVKNPTNAIRDTFRLYISNLDNTTYNTIYKYILTDENGTFERTYDGGSCNLLPFYEEHYQSCITCWQHACPPWKFIFPLDHATDRAEFKIDHVLLGDITSADTIIDTMTYHQTFYNYYAYDDGTPEAGIGLTSTGSKLACQFKLNKPDSVYSIQMLFNKTQDNANDDYFDLAIWRDNNGVPGEMIYVQQYELPKFTDNLFQIQTYKLDSAIPVNNIFYIGWIQENNTFLNVGFDTYNNSRTHTFYSITNEWYQSIYEGSVIIRPVMSDKEITNIPENDHEDLSIKIYPNPVNGNEINMLLPKSISYNIRSGKTIIYNLFGQKVYKGSYKEQLNVSHLQRGMYIVKVILPGSDKHYSGKFLIVK